MVKKQASTKAQAGKSMSYASVASGSATADLSKVRPEFRVWLMIVVPHRGRICGVEEQPGTHCRQMPIAEKLIIILSVPGGIKSRISPVIVYAAGLHVIDTTFRSLVSLSFPSGFAD